MLCRASASALATGVRPQPEERRQGGVRVKASEPKAASWLHSDAAAGTALRAATARAHHAGEA